jgi:hypothetical protein
MENLRTVWIPVYTKCRRREKAVIYGRYGFLIDFFEFASERLPSEPQPCGWRQQLVKKSTRLVLWIAGGLGALVLALMLFVTVVAPRVISDETTKALIRAEFAKAVGGSLDFDQLRISLLPTPGVAVDGASVAIPDVGQGKLESLKVYPRILPLFTGKVHVGKVRIHKPTLRVDLAKLPSLGREKSEQDPSRSLPEGAASLFDELASKLPNLEVEIKGGTLELVEEGETAFQIQDLDLDVLLPPAGPEARITCRSNLWQDLTIDGRLDAEDLDGIGQIEISRFHPHLLTDRFFPDAGITSTESTLYLRVNVRTDGLRKFHGELKASAPGMVLSKDGEGTTLEVENLGITFSIDEEEIDLTLDQLKLTSPGLRMSGKFSMDKTEPAVRLDLEARDMDVDAARQSALCLGGDVRLVRDIFDYVRGGRIPVITFRSRASELGGLGADEAFRIDGRLEEGRIHIRGVDLDPEEVEGDVVISQGFLEGEQLNARLGNSQAQDGKLRVGLHGEDAPFHLDIAVDADMAEVRPILIRIIKQGTFVEELALVDHVTGRTQGRMILGESLKSVEAEVDVSQCSLSARYRRIPYSIRIDSGQVFYETDSISGRNMSGTLGGSSFSGLTYRVGFGDSPQLDIESGRLKLLMDEIHPWLMSYESLRDDLDLFRDVKGRIELTRLRLKGPVLRTAEWDFLAEGMVKDLVIDTPLCPKPVPFSSGRLKATEGELRFTEMNARLLDAPVVASGVLYDYLRGLSKAEVDLNGTIGSEAFAWVSGDVINLPPLWNLRTPFPLADARLVWNREGETSFKGKAMFPMGAKASIDLVQGPESFVINRLSVQDESSRATLSVTRSVRSLGLKFTGNLAYSTMDKIFLSDVAPGLNLKGDFILNIRLDKPTFSKVQGHLEAQDFTIRYNWLGLAGTRIEILSLEASEEGIRIEPSQLILEDSHISVQGDLRFDPEGIEVDMDLASDAIAWETIARVIDRAKSEEPADEEEPSYWPRVEGTVRCRAESFTYGVFTWQPLHASVTFSPEDVRVAVTEGDMCGISTLGVVNMDGEELSLDFRLIAKERDLTPTFPCLSDTARQVTGTFDLTGHVSGTAKGEAVVQALQGKLELSARSGNILQDPVLTKVFGVLNVTEVLRGKMPDLRSDELPYDSLTIKADLQDGTLVLNETVLSGPTVGIVGDGTVHLIDKQVKIDLIVAPLRTVDFIVEKTPIVKNIMGGKLVTVPVRIAGDWRDPAVTMLQPGAVGSRLLGIMKNTLMLPVVLVEPVLPKKDDEEEEESP